MGVISQALLWLDESALRFWAVAGAALGLVLAAAILPGTRFEPRSRWSCALFAFSIVACLAAFRWPTWFYPTEFNPDEAQMIASAITLQRFHVYWKFVDGTTHGPLCEYFLLIAAWLGAPLNYVTARIVAALLHAGSLLAVWGTLRCFTTERVARVAIVPSLAFLCFVSWEEFVHYASELPGAFLLSVAGWCIALALRPRPVTRLTAFASGCAGLALGAVPYTKLQSVPHALILAGIAALLLWQAKAGRAPQTRRTLLVCLVAGGLFPTAIVAGFLIVYGLLPQFHLAYLSSAAAYLQLAPHAFGQMPGKFFAVAALLSTFAVYFWGSLAFSLLYSRSTDERAPLRIGLIASWLVLAAALFTVLRPSREVPHYLHLLIMPMSLVTGFSLALATGRRSDTNSLRHWAEARPWLAFVALCIAPQMVDRLYTRNPYIGQLRTFMQESPSAAARYISERAGRDDTVAMWGWDSKLLVELGLPHGTREPHTAHTVTEWGLRPFYVERYVRDLTRNEPAWFVDSVGPGAFLLTDRVHTGHEAYPEVRRVIAENYEFVAEYGNRRIYRRKSPASSG